MSRKLRTLLILFGLLMTVLFGGLAVWSWGTGEQIWKDGFTEQQIAKEKPEKAHGQFSVDKRQVMSMTVDAYTLDDSWIWTKAVILDSKDRPVVDLTFNIEYYTGRDWSEGSQQKTKSFKVPPGDYKVLLYAEDAQRSTRWTDPGDERIRVSVEKGVVLSWYFEVLFILFAIGTVILLFISTED